MIVEDFGNYLGTTSGNPFSLPKPPQWWLKELKLFDDRLVIFPSQKRATFMLARKAFRSRGEPLTPDRMKLGPDNLVVPQNPDTVFMHFNRLVRVCEISPGVKWDMRVFHKLAAHDIQRLGGAAEVANKLDAMDDKKREHADKLQQAELEARGHDAYNAYKFVGGERISMTPNPLGRGSVTPNRVSVQVKAPAHPSAQRIVLTDATLPDPVKAS